VLLYARLSAEADYGTSGDLTISQARLAERCMVSVDTLQRTLVLLRDLGAVTWRAEGREATYTVRRALPTCRTGAVGAPEDLPHPSGSSDRTHAAPATAPGPRALHTPEVVQNHQKTPPTPQGAGGLPLVAVFGFDGWWQQYPRKVAKPVAQRAYANALKRGCTTGMLEDALHAWSAYWAARGEPEFIPHPSTWLNQDRWADDPPPLPQARRGTVQATVDVGRDVLATLAQRQRFGTDAVTGQPTLRMGGGA
jgi:hypothetical protein